MNQDSILYTLPQWFVFSAIVSIVYGWVEKKKIFRLIGPLLFFLLGLFAAFSIYNGSFSVNDFLTPQEIVNEEFEDETFDEVPFLMRLLPAYWSFIIAAILAIPAFYFEWKEKKHKNIITILTGLCALFGFFIIVSTLQNL